jgi:hypothetical protein
LPKLVSGLFRMLDDRYYGVADPSDEDELGSRQYDSIHLLLGRRDEVQKHFINGVLGDFDRLWTNGPQNLAPSSLTSDPKETGLSLVEDDELERSLAVTNIISACENRFHGELYALTSRFAHLAGDIELGIHSNPLGPAAVCNRFQITFSDLSLEMPVLLTIYKLLGKQMATHLGGLYEEVNALLSRAGILPKLAPGPAHARGESAEPPAGDASVSDAAMTQENLFPTLQALLAEYRPQCQGASSPLAANNLPAVATHELVGALSLLQGLSLELQGAASGVLNTTDLRRHLSDKLSLDAGNGRGTRALGQADADAFDVVAMLFEFSLEDPNLPDAMKALIARLQIPMVKVAILDKSFFSHKQHPARCLLNNLAWAAMGWSEDGDRSERSLFGRIESVVDRVVAGFQQDLSVFKRLNEEFSAYMQQEQRSAKIAEERTNKAVQGKELLQTAKQAVESEIERRLGGRARLPTAVRTLLEDAWRDVLVLTYLRQGPESKAWNDKLDVADLLLWSVKPKVEHNQRRDLLRMIPSLQHSLREGLDSIAYDQHKIARLIGELQACHTACLRGGRAPDSGSEAERRISPPPASNRAAGPTMADREPSMRRAAAEPPGCRDKFIETAKNLARGAWLELCQDKGKKSRIKLSWKSEIYDHYLFVNRRGVKVMETTLSGVAQLFRNGKASVLEQAETPFTDRALDTVVETLKGAVASSA